MKPVTNTPFPIDIENFNKKLTEGIWANDGFELLNELIKPIPDSEALEEKDEG